MKAYKLISEVDSQPLQCGHCGRIVFHQDGDSYNCTMCNKAALPAIEEDRKATEFWENKLKLEGIIQDSDHPS